MTKMGKIEVVNYAPSREFVLVERNDGRQYEVEIKSGEVYDVFAVGDTRRVSVCNQPIGLATIELVTEMLGYEIPEFYTYADDEGQVFFRLHR